MKFIDKLLEIDKEERKLRLLKFFMSSDNYFILPEISKGTHMHYYSLIKYLKMLVNSEMIIEKENKWVTGCHDNATITRGKKYKLNKDSELVKLFKTEISS